MKQLNGFRASFMPAHDGDDKANGIGRVIEKELRFSSKEVASEVLQKLGYKPTNTPYLDGNDKNTLKYHEYFTAENGDRFEITPDIMTFIESIADLETFLKSKSEIETRKEIGEIFKQFTTDKMPEARKIMCETGKKGDINATLSKLKSLRTKNTKSKTTEK